MGEVEAVSELRDVLDAAIRGKEIASGFFASLASAVEEVNLRRCFRRLAQEEWDHRKILLKHRRSLFGRPVMPGAAPPPAPGTAFAPLAVRRAIRSAEDLRIALRAAIRSEQEAHRFFTEASRHFDDRAVKVFLRILADEGLAQVEQLRLALDQVRGESTLRRRPVAARPAGASN